VAAPLCAETFSFSDDPTDIARSHWQFSLGTGWSIPLNVSETIPATQNTLVLGNWYGGEYRSTSLAKEARLGQATSFEGGLFYSVSPWLSFGTFGGLTTEHGAAVAGEDANLSLVWNGYNGYRSLPINTDGWTIRYGMTMGRVIPAVRIGPWLGRGNFQIKPYLTTGLGWYKVDQFAELSLPTVHWAWGWRYFSKTDQYAGGMGGAGVMMAIGNRGSISLEARYERVFSPGPVLQFITPKFDLSYHFGN
jgi:hypothetical protein